MNYDILNPILDYYQLTEADLKKRGLKGRICRNREYVLARQIYYAISKDVTKRSFADIGSDFNQDHSTVFHAVESIGNKIQTDKSFKPEYEKIYWQSTGKFLNVQYVEDADCTCISCVYKNLSFGNLIKSGLSDGMYLIMFGFPTIDIDEYFTLPEAKVRFEVELKKFLEAIK